MYISDLDYNLTNEHIAMYPPEKRGDSRLMIIDRSNKTIKHDLYVNLPKYLRAEDTIVLNETKVVKARLYLLANTGRKHEALFLREIVSDINLPNGNKCAIGEKYHIWEVIMNKSRKVRKGDVLVLEGDGDVELHVIEKYTPTTWLICTKEDMYQIFEEKGHVPLPPYIKRADDKDDDVRYNTVFAKQPGSVAAPTASLNMTPEILQMLKNNNVNVANVSLSIGWGTFSPIREEKIEDHKIHEEFISIDKENLKVINKTRQNGERIMALGTTSARTLESMNDPGKVGMIRQYSGPTDLYIYPGYEWKIVDMLLTNFHAPRTSLLAMVASFMGYDLMMEAYAVALKEKYRFLSYGDSMLII